MRTKIINMFLLVILLGLYGCISRAGFENNPDVSIIHFDFEPVDDSYDMRRYNFPDNSINRSQTEFFRVLLELDRPVKKTENFRLQVMADSGQTKIGIIDVTILEGSKTPYFYYAPNMGAKTTPEGITPLTDGRFWLACTSPNGHPRGNAGHSAKTGSEVLLRMGFDFSLLSKQHQINCVYDNVKWGTKFSTAFVGVDNTLNLRHSPDGLKWGFQGHLPGNPEPTTLLVGPGQAIDPEGEQKVIVYSNQQVHLPSGQSGSPGEFAARWGPSIGEWDPNSYERFIGMIPTSPPVVTYGWKDGDIKNWFVAFNRFGALEVRVLSTPGGFHLGNLAPRDFMQPNGEPTPPFSLSITSRGKSVFLARTGSEIVLTKGEIIFDTRVNATIKWDRSIVFNIVEPGFKPPNGAIAVTSNKNWYYIAAQARQLAQGGGGLYGSRVFVYRSADGEHWSRIGTSGAINGPDAWGQNHLSIAAVSDSKILVGAVSKVIQDSRPQFAAKVGLFDGSNWNEIPASTVFGTNLAPRLLSIIAHQSK